MEIWDVYDSQRIQTGKTLKRGQHLAPGEYHLTVHICVFDREGRLLIQQRSDDKSTWRSLWDISAAGSVIAGENSAEGAHRELLEELGLDRDFTDIRPHFTLNYKNGFGDYYFLVEDEIDLNTLSLQQSEVQAARYATCDEVIELIRSEKFIPYHESFLRMLFDMREVYSSFNPKLKEKLINR